MTQNRTEAETLWVTDKQMAERLGVPEKELRQILDMIERNPHHRFPRKEKIWGNRRYFPAVRAYFDAHYLNRVREVA